MYVTYTRIYGWSDYGGESSYQPGYRLENMMWMTLLVYDYIIPGDISIIDGNSVAIKSWEKAVLGNVREFESNSNDIFDIIMRELENDK